MNSAKTAMENRQLNGGGAVDSLFWRILRAEYALRVPGLDITPQMKCLFLILCVVLGFASVHAKEVRILAWDDAVAARSLAWIEGGEDIEISGLHPLRRSGAYPRAAHDAPVVIRALDRPPGEGKAVAELRCSVDAGFRRPLLILLADPVAPSGLRGLVIEDDTSSFGWGTMRFVNASGQDVIVRVERKTARVPAGWKPVDIQPGGISRNLEIRIALERSIDTPAYTAVWDHHEEARSLIFVLRGADSRPGSLAVKAIPEMKRTAGEPSVTHAE